MEAKLILLSMVLYAVLINVDCQSIVVGRLSWQSSTYGTYTASLGNDGNPSSNLYTGNSCSHTTPEANPWWAVDLGADNTHVQVVTIYNRANLLGYRLHNFIVGLSDVSPAVTTPSITNYRVCALYSGAVPDGEAVQVTCTDSNSGRYLIVQMPGIIPNMMTLCEVGVTSKFF